jgi:tRNA 2-thiouridine synthesizing protein B
MMILHVLNASPSSSAFRDCLNAIQTGDALVLMGDGVYAAVEGTTACEAMLATSARIHVLRTDATATGVVLPASEIGLIDMDDFVTLTERFQRQMSWY